MYYIEFCVLISLRIFLLNIMRHTFTKMFLFTVYKNLHINQMRIENLGALLTRFTSQPKLTLLFFTDKIVLCFVHEEFFTENSHKIRI